MTRKEAIQFLTDTGMSPEHIMELVEALSSSEKPNKWIHHKSEARRWKRRYLDLKQRIFKLEEQTRWIPVSERYPEDGQHILFSTKTGYVFEGRYDADTSAHNWLSYKDDTYAWNNVVTAWMPLPEPYKASPTGAEKEG